jgi:iron complex transport system substrate-binding protein
MKRAMGAMLVALALVTAACGDDDSGGTTPPDATEQAATTTAPATDSTAATETTDTTRSTAGAPAAPTTDAASDAGSAPVGDAFPVTIEHARGETTIEAAPERVATLGLQWTDVLLALDEEPIAHISEQLAGDGGIYPWQAGMLDDSTGLAARTADEIPYEQLAALQPDLILVTYLAADPEVYDRLNAIAPTIGLLGDRQVDRWQDLITVGGQIFGKSAEAAAVTAEIDDLMAATAAEYPGLAGKTFVMANFIPGDQIYVVADPEDGSSVFFQELGMTLDPDVLAAADGATGRAEFSLEQADLLDGDLLVIFSNGAEPSTLVGYDQLGVVAAGASAELGYADVVGFNTPTPLSIPHSLQVVRPQLEAAAGGA